ncbi:MAG TPA: hypothetical protein VGP02_12025, partial [Mycobacteriales bacterium]|nr:hypothetical protein [Mycobacteriales bacterium]
KKQIHQAIGHIAGRLIGWFGPPRFVRVLAEEIASRVPIPFIDQNATIAARGVQVTGVIMCAIQGRVLVDCACFADVVMAEGKERMKELLQKAMGDWADFRHLPAAHT